jgi:hypothetical protein
MPDGGEVVVQDGAVRRFLHALSPDKRRELLAFIKAQLKTHMVYQWNVDAFPEFSSYLPVDGSAYSGSFWSQWATCEVVSGVTKHERYQFNLKANNRKDPKTQWVVATPTKRTIDGSPVCKRLKRLLGNGETLESAINWQAFKDAGYSPRGEVRERPIVKIYPHWVALICRDDLVETPEPIPAACGAGASIGHDCDQPGCITCQHLHPEPVHKANLARQRCQGVHLLVLGNIIVKQTGCAHTRDGEILTSCRKLVITELPIERVRVALSVFDAAKQSEDGFAPVVSGAGAKMQAKRRLIDD